MEHLVDLDVLAARLRLLVPAWERTVRVGDFTWRDERAAWPQPIVSDRDAVAVPESLGFTMSSDEDSEFFVVVWTGGWADTGMLKNGVVTMPYLEFTDADGALAAVESFVAQFLA